MCDYVSAYRMHFEAASFVWNYRDTIMGLTQKYVWLESLHYALVKSIRGNDDIKCTFQAILSKYLSIYFKIQDSLVDLRPDYDTTYKPIIFNLKTVHDVFRVWIVYSPNSLSWTSSVILNLFCGNTVFW